MEFKDILRKLRVERGLTQEQLGKELELSAITIRSYEAGRRTPNSDALVKMEKFFNISGLQLHGIEDKKMSWDDSEIMNEVHSSFSFMFKNILSIIQSEDDHNQKMLFDIVSGLQSIMDIKNKNVQSLILERLAMDVYNERNLADKMSEMSSSEK